MCSQSSHWLRGTDLNRRSPDYEPGGIPNFPTPRRMANTIAGAPSLLSYFVTEAGFEPANL